MKAYLLYHPGAPEDPDAIVLAKSPEEAARILKAELRGQQEGEIWEIAFPIGLFYPPRLGSEEERITDKMWVYHLQARGGREVLVLLNLEKEIEVRMLLRERPLVAV